MEEKSSAESRSLLNATAGWLRWDRTWGECLRALPTPPPRPSPPHAAARCGREPAGAVGSLPTRVPRALRRGRAVPGRSGSGKTGKKKVGIKRNQIRDHLFFQKKGRWK